MDSQGTTEVVVLGANDVDLQPGQKVGEYVVDQKVGEGGFGSVYRATHPLIGKVVALKVLNRQYSAQPEMVSRFVAEARAVNQIRHRNIIDIFAFGQVEDGRHYYVMEYLEGQPLDEYLAQVGRIPLGEAMPILRAVARALDAAHAKGIAHRDLKPENIFLARETDGTVFPKLLDFGIAKLLGTPSGAPMHKTRTGAPIGTPYYMSPEQCRGRDVDHRTDIYAFGVVAFKLLTGEVPFDGEDYMDILVQQIQNDPPAPSSRNPELPTSVDDGVLWMLKKDPAERPPNLIAAVRALEDAAIAAGVDVGPSTPTGVHATTSAFVRAQTTPSGVMPLPRTASRDSSLANAATMDAAALSEPMPAVTPGSRRRRWLPIALGLCGAVVAGAVVFVVVRHGGGADASVPIEVPPPPVQTATPAPAPVPPPAPPPAPPMSTRVTIEITGTPAGTEVFGPTGVLLGTAPGPLRLERSDGDVVLKLRSNGYKPASVPVRPTVDQTITVKLTRKPVPRGQGRDPGRPRRHPPQPNPGRDEIEDPFKTP